MPMTPEERHNLVSRANKCRLELGLEIARVSLEPWLMDRPKLLQLYNELAEVDRALCAEVDWPRPRTVGGA